MIAVLISLMVPARAEGPSPLEAAYQKEYAYLKAEKGELDTRLSGFDAEAERLLAQANAEIETLQAKLVAVTREADRAEDAFDAIERETAKMDDGTALLTTTVQQGSDTLGLGSNGSTADPAAAVPALFTAASAAIATANQVGWKDGSFFLPDGTAVNGRIYTWGQVAAWGVSDAGNGALAPAGEGRLQLRREFGEDTALVLSKGERPRKLEIQLFEPERGAEEAEKAGGLGQLLQDAGTMGQVLFGLGCVSALLVVIRGATLLLARRGGRPLIQRVVSHVATDRLDLARAAVGRRDNPTARVLGAILDAADRSLEERERVVDESLLREVPGIDRFASALVVITAGSPLLGLLGTVTGMIATFDVITEHGTGNPKLMSAGIAEALICTALGLSVAIPTLLCGNVLASLAESVKNNLERGALGMLNAIDQRERGLTPVVAETRVRETA